MILLRATAAPTTLTLEIRGRATVLESPAVHAAMVARLASGLQTLRVDLRACSTIDSTFSGTLLAFWRRLDASGGTLRLVSPSRRVVEQLREMGLEDFYPTEDAPPPSPVEPAEEIDGTESPSDSRVDRRESLRRSILEAHEELARLPCPVPEFISVLTELRKDATGAASTRKGASAAVAEVGPQLLQSGQKDPRRTGTPWRNRARSRAIHGTRVASDAFGKRRIRTWHKSTSVGINRQRKTAKLS